MLHYNNLIEVIKANKEDKNKGIFFISKEKENNFISYSELYDKSIIRLGKLQKKGLKKNDKLIFQVDKNEDFVLLFWACILGGIVPVPLIAAVNKEQRTKLLNVFKITDGASIAFSKKNQDAIIKDLKNDAEFNMVDLIIERTVLLEELEDGIEYGEIESVDENDVAFIQFSSGSTGIPKGVTLTHKNLVTNVKDIIEGSALNEKDSTLSWLPLTHDMGIIGFHLVPFYSGLNQTIMSSSLFIHKPMLWMDATSKQKATLLSSPNFGYKYFLSHFNEDENEWDLSSVRLIFNGAEPIDVDLAKDFINNLSIYNLRDTSIFTVYGMAEASLGVSFPKPNTEMKYLIVNRSKLTIGQPIQIVESHKQSGIKLSNNGYPLTHCKVRILDDENTQLSEGYVGNIEISGDNVTKSYYNDEETTSTVINKDGWLSTGDLGFIYEECIYVTGRKKDLIIINGVNYYSSDLERVCSEVEGIQSNKVIACSIFDSKTSEESLGIFISHRGNDEELMRKIKDIKKNLIIKVGIDPKYIIPIKKIHKTTSGKIMRYKYVEEFIDGVYDELIEKISQLSKSNNIDSENDDDSVTKNLLQIAKEELGVNNIDLEEQLMSLGADSIKISRIHSRLMELYPDKIAISDFYTYPTIKTLVQHIVEQNSIEIIVNKFPEDKLTQNGEKSNIRLVLESGINERLKEISESEGVEVKSILFSIYLYLFGHLSNNNKIAIQIIRSNDLIEQVEIDLSIFNNMSVLYKNSERILKFNGKYYNKSVINNNNEGAIILAFNYYDSNYNDLAYDFYDLLLNVDNSKELNFIFGKILKIEVARDFVEKFNNILGQI